MLTLRSSDEESVGVSAVGVARAGLLARGLPRMIDIIISGRPGSTTAYTLDLRIQSAAVCAPDNFEPPLGNASQDQPQQTLRQAPPLVSRLCQGDADWFCSHRTRRRHADHDPEQRSLKRRGGNNTRRPWTAWARFREYRTR